MVVGMIRQETTLYHQDEWENDFKLWTIGTSYCHSRQFKVDEDTIKVFQMYNQAVENVKSISSTNVFLC